MTSKVYQRVLIPTSITSSQDRRNSGESALNSKSFLFVFFFGKSDAKEEHEEQPQANF